LDDLHIDDKEFENEEIHEDPDAENDRVIDDFINAL